MKSGTVKLILDVAKAIAPQVYRTIELWGQVEKLATTKCPPDDRQIIYVSACPDPAADLICYGDNDRAVVQTAIDYATANDALVRFAKGDYYIEKTQTEKGGEEKAWQDFDCYDGTPFGQDPNFEYRITLGKLQRRHIP